MRPSRWSAGCHKVTVAPVHQAEHQQAVAIACQLPRPGCASSGVRGEPVEDYPWTTIVAPRPVSEGRHRVYELRDQPPGPWGPRCASTGRPGRERVRRQFRLLLASEARVRSTTSGSVADRPAARTRRLDGGDRSLRARIYIVPATAALDAASHRVGPGGDDFHQICFPRAGGPAQFDMRAVIGGHRRSTVDVRQGQLRASARFPLPGASVRTPGRWRPHASVTGPCGFSVRARARRPSRPA